MTPIGFARVEHARVTESDRDEGAHLLASRAAFQPPGAFVAEFVEGFAVEALDLLVAQLGAEVALGPLVEE
uniref:hypothetical protein n=1 Tax=Mycobacterium sp. HUMS_1102779 TaxID=3383487 RepID=UPI00389AF973